MDILNFLDDLIALVLGILLMAFAYRFMIKSRNMGAKNWENAGFNILHMGFFLAVGEFVNFSRIFVVDNLGLFEAFRTIGYCFWVASIYFLFKMAYDISKDVEEMLF